MHSKLTTSLVEQGLPREQADSEATRISQTHSATGAIPHFVRLDFAYATKSVFEVMAGVMVVATLIAFAGLRRGVQREVAEPAAAD